MGEWRMLYWGNDILSNSFSMLIPTSLEFQNAAGVLKKCWLMCGAGVNNAVMDAAIMYNACVTKTNLI
jgi:hypothetical protein